MRRRRTTSGRATRTVVAQDRAEAVSWHHSLAAIQGHTSTQQNLGSFCEHVGRSELYICTVVATRYWLRCWGCAVLPWGELRHRHGSCPGQCPRRRCGDYASPQTKDTRTHRAKLRTRSVVHNGAEVMRWFRVTADQGHPTARLFLRGTSSSMQSNRSESSTTPYTDHHLLFHRVFPPPNLHHHVYVLQTAQPRTYLLPEYI